MMKKLISLFLAALTAFCSISIVAAGDGALLTAAPTLTATKAAEALHTLGLVGGYATSDGSVNFALGDKLTRAQAFVLVVRFIGAEKDATANVQAHPFTDVPSWAAPYIGYVYANGITKGVSATKFDPDSEVSEAAFLTIMLRVLGYDDGAGDFAWNDPYALAKNVGLCDAKAAGFDRGGAFVICYRALTAAVKSGKTIDEQLIDKGVFTSDAYKKTMGIEADNKPIVPGTPKNPETIILPIASLNTKGNDGDHANDDYKTASLETNYRQTVELTAAKTGYFRYENAWYPRVKKVNDDLYLLLYHYGELGLHMYYATSADGVNWNAPQVLWNAKEHMFTYEGGAFDGVTENFAAVNPDACVLDNGDIICVYAVRPPKGYMTYSDLSGLWLMRGTVNEDNTISWSAETKIYTGQVWEPGIHQRSDGTVEVYFTQIAPYIDLYGFDTEKRSGGVGMIVSKDGGYSWTPDIQPGDANYYRATTVIQTELGNKVGPDGVSRPYFGGQMPVPVELYNGKTMVVYEIQNLDKTFWGSYATSGDSGKWKALALEEVGPDTLYPTPYKISSPYVARFPSGEVYMTYTKNVKLYARLGNPDGSEFSDKEFIAVNSVGIWGSAEVVGTHEVITANQHQSGGLSGLKLVHSYLNHRINAPKVTVNVDGYTNDWDEIENTDALFVGSETQAQMTLRAAHDDENIYFLVSRLDYYLNEGDTATICIAAGASADYRIEVGLDGIRSIDYYSGGAKKSSTSGGKAAVKVLGTVGNNDDRDEGYVVELAIPKSLVGLAGASSFKVRPALTNVDGTGATADTLTGVSTFSTALWPSVVLD